MPAPGRFLTLVCLLMLAAAAGRAQTAPEQKPALSLKLTAPATTLCAGTSIELWLEIKNTAPEVQPVDTDSLWNNVVYSEFKPDGSGRGGGQSSDCSHCGGDFIILYEGDTFWAASTFPLDNEFFRKAGTYDIAVSLQSATSNRVKFKLVDCGKTESEVTR